MAGLRFCMLTTFYPPASFGGDAIGVQRLARALVRRGHRVTVVHDRDAFRALGGVEAAASEVDDGVETIPLGSRLPRLSALLTHQLGRPVVHAPRIRGLLDGGAFDVVNLHNVSLVGGPGLLAMGDAVKLYMAHEHWLVCPSHVLWRHDREACTGRQCLRCVLRYRRPPQLWRYTGALERALDHVDAFIAMSEFSRRKHREFGFRREMRVVPYFLPDAEESANGAEAPPQPAESRPYFLYVGRLERLKGLDDVLPVFARLAEADLLIAGEGAHGGALRRAASGLSNVRFLGRRSQRELTDLYRGALALVVPSVGFETFGIILIEAFRQGLPVVARDLGPFPEIVQASGGGELFRDGDHLLALLRGLLADPERRARLGTAAREGFRRHWSEAAVVPRYLEVVREAAEVRGRPEILARLAVGG